MTQPLFDTVTAPTEYRTLIRNRPRTHVVTHILARRVGNRAHTVCGEVFDTTDAAIALSATPADRFAIDCWECANARGIRLI